MKRNFEIRSKLIFSVENLSATCRPVFSLWPDIDMVDCGKTRIRKRQTYHYQEHNRLSTGYPPPYAPSLMA